MNGRRPDALVRSPTSEGGFRVEELPDALRGRHGASREEAPRADVPDGSLGPPEAEGWPVVIVFAACIPVVTIIVALLTVRWAISE